MRRLVVTGGAGFIGFNFVRDTLAAEPENGAFLDSLGWAYYRKGDLGEAEKYLGQAATRLPCNSEVQDHFGDVLAKRGRLPDAVDAWMRALDGDGSDIDRPGIQKKINDARSKLKI
jgi:tetratricopeptide (TPR) repeat protein